MAKPTVVLVHGAWHLPQHYERLTTQLRAAKFEVHVPMLPTNGVDAANFTKEDDDRLVRGVIEGLVEQGQQVIVLCHSYGGAVTTQAVGPELGRRHRRDRGLPGGVLHLVYMAAFMLREGESARSISVPRPNPEPVEVREDGTSFIFDWAQRDMFYGDVDADAVRAACASLVPHSLRDAVPVSHCAWKHLPTTYLRCTLDHALWLPWQDGMISAAREVGFDFDVETFEASHSPFMSMPAEMVAAVERVAAKYGTGQ